MMAPTYDGSMPAGSGRVKMKFGSTELKISLSNVVVNGQFACNKQRFVAPQKLSTVDLFDIRWETFAGFSVFLGLRILFKSYLSAAEPSPLPLMAAHCCSRG